MLSLNDEETRQLLQDCSLYTDRCTRLDSCVSRTPNEPRSIKETGRPSGPSPSSGDVSSLAVPGSESDAESDSDDDMSPYSRTLPSILAQAGNSKDEAETASGALAGSKVWLEANGSLYCLHKALVSPAKVSYGDAQLKQAVDAVVSMPTKTVIIMLSAGHFAGAVFDGSTVVIHKTFHRYVVRAKRGTVQSVHDAQGKNAKSAGANIRRHNEAALKNDIMSVLQRWSQHIQQASLVFLRIPLYQRSTFFGGRSPLLEKGCQRIRTVPFTTRRPTFKEVQRVHTMLFSLTCHGLVCDSRDSPCAVTPSRTEPTAAASNAESTSSPVLWRRATCTSSPATLSRRERRRLENPRCQQLPAEFAAALAADLETAAHDKGMHVNFFELISCGETVTRTETQAASGKKTKRVQKFKKSQANQQRNSSLHQLAVPSKASSILPETRHLNCRKRVFLALWFACVVLAVNVHRVFKNIAAAVVPC